MHPRFVHGLNEAKVLSPETRRAFSIRTSPHITGNTRAILSLNPKHSNVHNVYQDKKHQYVQPMKIPFTLRKKKNPPLDKMLFLSIDHSLWFLILVFLILILLSAYGIQMTVYFYLTCHVLLSIFFCLSFSFSSQVRILFWLLTQLLL